MHPFQYRDGQLWAEDLAIESLAAEVGTPFYLYSEGAVRGQLRDLKQALIAAGLDPLICYSMKANPSLAIMRALLDEGAGADVVSEGELRRALLAGVPPQKIVFAGVGKTAEEMRAGLEAGILQFNVESRDELLRLNQVAASLGRTAKIALRVNPDVDARTHAKITTGTSENKFGIDIALAPEIMSQAAALDHVELEGLAVHIGSQLTDLSPYAAAFSRLAELFQAARDAGHAMKRLDLGGGIGISYEDGTPPDFPAYAEIARKAVGHLGIPLIFEPGRAIVGHAGLLISRVLYAKQGINRRFLILDAAMNDLIRPTLYDAWHDILPVAEPGPNTPLLPQDVVGPICESGDIFAEQRPLPELAPGDLVAICAAGAYGATMSSLYNSRLPAPEVLVRGGEFAVVKPRLDYEAMLRQERLPPWLADAPA